MSAHDPLSTARILVTNDDGIHAPGLRYLEEIAHSLSEEVWVVAPEFEQSGAGHSLSLTEPLRVRRLEARRFAVRGTPTDCVMFAVNHLMRDVPPTLILSGINRGGNLAEDITYSGTVAAAIEGALAGIPAIALSQCVRPRPERTNWQPARRFARATIEAILACGWPEGVLININFPSCPVEDVRGMRVTRQGRRDLGGLIVEERIDTRGVPYYWFGLSRTPGVPPAETDLEAVRAGYISITPLHLDLTHHPTRSRLKEAIAAHSLFSVGTDADGGSR